MGKKQRVKRKRIPFATTLSPAARAALEELAQRSGLACAGVIETLIRDRAATLGIDLDSLEPRSRTRRKAR